MQKASKPSFIRRNGFLILAIVIVVIGAGWAMKALSGSKPVAHKPREFSMVQVALPPPPPPPPKPPEPQPREETPDDTREMVAPDPIAADEPDAPVDEAPAEADAPMGTNIQSDGPADGFGLTGRGGGGIIGGGTIGGGRGGSGSRWSRYEAPLKQNIQDAIRSNEKTRSASIDLSIRIWPNKEGIIERVRLLNSTGDAELDRTLRDEVLTGLQLASPPPEGMPLPISMRIVARRP